MKRLKKKLLAEWSPVELAVWVERKRLLGAQTLLRANIDGRGISALSISILEHLQIGKLPRRGVVYCVVCCVLCSLLFAFSFFM